MANEGDLRVWWIPQVPGSPFIVYVDNLTEAALIMDTLARYDMFQLEQNIKPDFSNAGGLEIYEKDPESHTGFDWADWYDEDGNDFDRWREIQAEKASEAAANML